VIEWAKALFFISFLIHRHLEADMVAGGDLEVDPGSAGVIMVVVGRRDAIRRRAKREVLSKIKLDLAVQVSYSYLVGSSTNGSAVAVDNKDA
jgi:hypothetical protein